MTGSEIVNFADLLGTQQPGTKYDFIFTIWRSDNS